MSPTCVLTFSYGSPLVSLTFHHFGLSAEFQKSYIIKYVRLLYYHIYLLLNFTVFNTDMFENHCSSWSRFPSTCLRITAVLGVGFLPHYHPNSYVTSYNIFSKVRPTQNSILELFIAFTVQPTLYTSHYVKAMCLPCP